MDKGKIKNTFVTKKTICSALRGTPRVGHLIRMQRPQSLMAQDLKLHGFPLPFDTQGKLNRLS